MTTDLKPLPVSLNDCVVSWTEYDRHMVVHDAKDHGLLMATYSGYVSPRLTPDQIKILNSHYDEKKRRD